MKDSERKALIKYLMASMDIDNDQRSYWELKYGLKPVEQKPVKRPENLINFLDRCFSIEKGDDDGND